MPGGDLHSGKGARIKFGTPYFFWQVLVEEVQDLHAFVISW
jgi:hypothetical protein